MGRSILKTIDEIVDYLIENGDVPKRKLAKMFDITEYAALEAKKRARTERIRAFGPRIGFFDLETTGLRPEFDRLICGSVLSYPSGESVTYRIDETKHEDFSDDRELAVLIRERLEKHHILCGWNSKGFDIPFLNTRLSQQGERRIKGLLHIDPMWQYRGWRGLKPRNSKLSTVAEFWQLKERKMEVDGQVWVKAQGGNREAIDILCARCESDAELTAQVVGKTFDADLIKNIEKYG
jgi:uncharacterized protein YprB with RNaseH-like and TPR domain